jgi:transcriptional regulator with XRE-family HTH domain
MTITDRLNLIREDAGDSKLAMSKKLNISQPSVVNLCNGKCKPSPQTVTLLCREYSVSEEWLLHGTGEMYVTPPVEERATNAVSAYVKSESDVQKKFMRLASMLTPDQLEAVDSKNLDVDPDLDAVKINVTYIKCNNELQRKLITTLSELTKEQLKKLER